MERSVYDKFRKIISDQDRKIRQQQEKIRRLKQREQERIQRLKKREQEKIRRLRQQKQEKIQRLRQRERVKRENAMEQIRTRERLRFQKQRKKEEQARLKKETQKWEREIKKEERRQAKVLDDLRWRGSKKFRTIRTKLQNKLKRIEKSGKNIRPRLISNAIKKNTTKWGINGNGFKDPVAFLDITTPAVERLINSTDSVGKKVNTVLVCKMIRSNAATAENTITIAHFRSKTHSIISKEDTTTEYPVMKEKNVRVPRQVPKTW